MTYAQESKAAPAILGIVEVIEKAKGLVGTSGGILAQRAQADEVIDTALGVQCSGQALDNNAIGDIRIS